MYRQLRIHTVTGTGQIQELEAEVELARPKKHKATRTIYMCLGQVRSGWRQGWSKVNTTEAAVVTTCLVVILLARSVKTHQG